MEEMATFLSSIGAFFTQVMEWVSAVINVIIENPALTVLVFGMGIVGFAVGILGRLMHS